MGSRVMHSIINNEIASRMKIEDRAAFLLGGIAPDAVSPKGIFPIFIKGERMIIRVLFINTGI